VRRLYADKLVIVSAVLIVLFSGLFALVQSSARSTAPAADKMVTPDVSLKSLGVD
jgi:hypothetical protein